MRKHRVGKAFAFAGVVVLAILGFGFLVERLWNWLMPALFGFRSITFLQALGLLVLCKILFGGLHRHGCRSGRWKRGMAERWARMSPEEREHFRAGLGGGRPCGFGSAGRPAAEPSQR